MTGSVEKAVAEIRRGRRYPVYLLLGDEFLAKAAAKAIIEALVPPEHRSLNVETVEEDRDAPSLPMRVRTVPLFGGSKVVVVHDSRAFVSKQTADNLARKSLEAWQTKEILRATRLFLQILATAGAGEDLLDRAERGTVSRDEWARVFSTEPDPEAEQWLREVARHAIAEGMEIPEADGASLSGIYDQILQRGIPPETSLILTAESADERRAIFKKIAAAGFVIDCTVRSKRPWDPQMNPEAARARIRGLVAAAGKAIDEAAVAGIVQRTGASMRGLVSEVEKVLLYVGSRPAVTTADVLEVFSGSREASIFDLTNAVSGKDPAKALAAFRGLLAQREPVPAILGILAAEVRALIIARCALEQRLGGALDPAMSFEAFRSRILPRLGEGVQGDDGSASKLLAMNPFRAFRLLQAASAFSLQALLRGLEAIHETDLSLKSAGYPEALLLEQLLIRLCAGPAPSSPSPAASGRA